MSSIVSRASPPARDSGALDVLIEGPESGELIDADLRRLFPGSTLMGARRDRLRHWPRVVVRLDHVLVGVATYTEVDRQKSREFRRHRVRC